MTWQYRVLQRGCWGGRQGHWRLQGPSFSCDHLIGGPCWTWCCNRWGGRGCMCVCVCVYTVCIQCISQTILPHTQTHTPLSPPHSYIYVYVCVQLLPLPTYQTAHTHTHINTHTQGTGEVTAVRTLAIKLIANRLYVKEHPSIAAEVLVCVMCVVYINIYAVYKHICCI